MVVVPKLRPEGGSNGCAGLIAPRVPVQTFVPVEPSHMFQNVHLDRGGAPWIFAVSAWRKYHLFTGAPLIAPDSIIKRESRRPPATKIRESRPKMLPSGPC